MVSPEAASQEDAGDAEVPCALITGQAGVGKTYQVLQRIAREPKWAVLSSTTGISSVNLGCTTLNSLLGYYDEDSLRDLYIGGRLGTKLRGLRDEGWANLLVEECSMLTAPALDMLYRGAGEARGLGLVLVGDFCQLPPVRGRWAFEADCWDAFVRNTTRLDKVYRQGQEIFLRALAHARAGEGAVAAATLNEAGASWQTSLDTEWDGTTIVPKNDMVDRFNGIALARVPGRAFTLTSQRWGRQRSEWKLVPERMDLKLGAYVMLLANQPGGAEGDFLYVNGDCGHVVGYDHKAGLVEIELVRNSEVVRVGKLTRDADHKDKPEGVEVDKAKLPGYHPFQHRNLRGRWVEGQVEFWPLRLAYATTVHKSQSLSLDRVQVDYRHGFFKSPGMLYTALSRCRTLEGLRLVGMREVFAKHCQTDPAVRRFL